MRGCGFRAVVIVGDGAPAGAPPRRLAPREKSVMMDAMNRHRRSSFRRTAMIAAGPAIRLITSMIWILSTDRSRPIARIEMPNGPIVVEIPATPAARAAGLSNRDELQGIDGSDGTHLEGTRFGWRECDSHSTLFGLIRTAVSSP